MSRKPETMLWLDDHRGRYIPRDFANSFSDRIASTQGVTDEDWAILEAGPDHDDYWETWDDVYLHCVVIGNGTTYTLHQDGPLWLIPEGMEWDDATDWFVWPDEDDNA